MINGKEDRSIPIEISPVFRSKMVTQAEVFEEYRIGTDEFIEGMIWQSDVEPDSFKKALFQKKKRNSSKQ